MKIIFYLVALPFCFNHNTLKSVSTIFFLLETHTYKAYGLNRRWGRLAKQLVIYKESLKL